jgi:hypothetical protein
VSAGGFAKRRAEPYVMANIVYTELQAIEVQRRRIGGQPRWRSFGRRPEFEDRNARHGCRLARTRPDAGDSHFRLKSGAEPTGKLRVLRLYVRTMLRKLYG